MRPEKFRLALSAGVRVVVVVGEAVHVRGVRLTYCTLIPYAAIYQTPSEGRALHCTPMPASMSFIINSLF